MSENTITTTTPPPVVEEDAKPTSQDQNFLSLPENLRNLGTPPADAPVDVTESIIIVEGRRSRPVLENTSNRQENTVTDEQIEKLEGMKTRNSLAQPATEVPQDNGDMKFKKNEMAESMVEIEGKNKYMQKKTPINMGQSSIGGESEISNHVSLGRLNLDKERLLEEQQMELGFNELLEINPDTWKNIAMPIITAIKRIILTSNKTHSKLFDTQMLLEETGQRQQATAMRMNRDLIRFGDRFEITIKQADNLHKSDLLDLKNQQTAGLMMVEKQFDSYIWELRDKIALINAEIPKKANEEELRKWVTELVTEKTTEIKTLAINRVEKLGKKLEEDKDNIKKYFNMKLEKIQEKQFTVEGLVGDDPKAAHTYIGEYLQEQHKINKDKLEGLDVITKKTKETLATLSEFVDYQLAKQVPKTFEDMKKKLGLQIDSTEQYLSTTIKELERKTIEELLPRQKLQIDALESNLLKLKSDIPIVIDLESQKMMAHVQVAMEHLEKQGFEISALQEQLIEKGETTDLLDKKFSEHVNNLQETLGKAVADKVSNLQLLIKDTTDALNSKIEDLVVNIGYSDDEEEGIDDQMKVLEGESPRTRRHRRKSITKSPTSKLTHPSSPRPMIPDDEVNQVEELKLKLKKSDSARTETGELDHLNRKSELYQNSNTLQNKSDHDVEEQEIKRPVSVHEEVTSGGGNKDKSGPDESRLSPSIDPAADTLLMNQTQTSSKTNLMQQSVKESRKSTVSGNKPGVSFKKVPINFNTDDYQDIKEYASQQRVIKLSSNENGEEDTSLQNGGKDLQSKYEKLQDLVIHSLKVVEKIAVTIDGLPEALQHIQRHFG